MFDGTEPECGNAELEEGEECDDGNLESGDGCGADCTIENGAECGNSELEDGEECDDGNLDTGDGCDAECLIEGDYYRISEPDSRDEALTLSFGDVDILTVMIDLPPGDTDWIAINLEEPTTLMARTEAPNPEGAGQSCNGDTILEFYEGDAQSYVERSDDDGVGLCSLLDPRENIGMVNLSAGIHYFQVLSYSGRGTDQPNLLIIERINPLEIGDPCGFEVLNPCPFNSWCDFGETSTCIENSCGDEHVMEAEECEDSNEELGDGCEECMIVEIPVGNACVPPYPCAEGSFCHPETTVCSMIACGDAVVSEGELCDDGNMIEDDGCTSGCEFNPYNGEVEPDTMETSYPLDFDETGRAAIVFDLNPEGDEDFFSFVVEEATDIVIETVALGYEGCNGDTEIFLYAQGAEAVLENDDDGGQGFCSRISRTGEDQLEPGVYIVKVAPLREGALVGGNWIIVQQMYDLVVDDPCVPHDPIIFCPEESYCPEEAETPICTLHLCGDGVIGPEEFCDDGNEDLGDGCELCEIIDIPIGNLCEVGGFACAEGGYCPEGVEDPVCTLHVCGDGVLSNEEDCDDGNEDLGDGCELCEVQDVPDGNSCEPAGFRCAETSYCPADVAEPVCTAHFCGDGIIAPQEDCDGGEGCGDDCLPLPDGDISAGGDFEGGFEQNSYNEFILNVDEDSFIILDTGGVEGACPGDTTMRVYSIEDQIRVDFAYNDDGGEGRCSQIEEVFPAGAYRVRVQGFSGATIPEYLLSIEIEPLLDPGSACELDGLPCRLDTYCPIELEEGEERLCTLHVCGDGILSTEEACDDGNEELGDGCEECQFVGIPAGNTCDPNGFACIEEYYCNRGEGEELGVCAAMGCGDGILAEDEECDDGNGEEDDGCDSSCHYNPYSAEPNDEENPYILEFDEFGIAGVVFAIEEEGDHDWFSFTLDEPAEIAVITSDIDGVGCPGDNEIRLYIDEENFIYDDDGTFSDIYGACGQINPVLDGEAASLAAGSYRVRVNGLGDNRVISAMWIIVRILSDLETGDICLPGDNLMPCPPNDFCPEEGEMVCTAHRCGDGVVAPNEFCDDGNEELGDGCEDCMIVDIPIGNNCDPEGADCVDGSYCDDGGICVIFSCGDGVESGEEECDDGNQEGGDGCEECLIVGVPVGNACEADGFDCVEGSYCSEGDVPVCTEHLCGDAVVGPDEDCDDGGNENGDGCDAVCIIEPIAEVTGGGNFPSSFEEGAYDEFEVFLEVPATIMAEVTDAEGTCDMSGADPYLELFSLEEGARVQLDSDDDSGTGRCSKLTHPVEAGIYRIRVRDLGNNDAMAYTLHVNVLIRPAEGEACDPEDRDLLCGEGFYCAEDQTCTAHICGDGLLGPIEECDDGNAEDGDACSAACELVIHEGLEPGDFLQQIYPGLWMDGNFEAENIPNLWTFSLEENVLFSAYSHNGEMGCDFDTRFILYEIIIDEEGEEVLDWVDSDDDGGVDSCSLLSAMLEPGDYLLRITSNEPVPEYTLTVAHGFESAEGEACDRRSINSFCAEGLFCNMSDVDGVGVCENSALEFVEEIEPDSTSEEAGLMLLNPGSVVHASLTPVMDVYDVFVLEVLETSLVNIDTSDNMGGCPGDTQLTMIDPNIMDEEGISEAASFSNRLGFNDDGGVGLCSILSLELEPGTYYFAVNEFLRDGALDYYIRFWIPEYLGAGERCDAEGVINQCGEFLECVDENEDNDGICIDPRGQEMGEGEACDRSHVESFCSDGLFCNMTDVDGIGICTVHDNNNAIAEIEPDETSEDASVMLLNVGDTVHANITPDEDEFDVFVVEILEAATVNIETSNNEGGCSGDSQLSMIDPEVMDRDGVSVAASSAQRLEFNDDGGQGLCSILTLDLIPGIYYFAVNEYQSNNALEYYISFWVSEFLSEGERCDAEGIINICGEDLECLDENEDNDGICTLVAP